jgi:hypothetical protein
VSGPKCSHLTPSAAEQLRERYIERIRSAQAEIAVCETAFRSVATRLRDLGEEPGFFPSGSDLSREISRLVSQTSESVAAELAQREVVRAKACLNSDRDRVTQIVGALQKRFRAVVSQSEDLSNRSKELSCLANSSELPVGIRSTIADLCSRVRHLQVIPPLELTRAGIAELRRMEKEFESIQSEIASLRADAESAINEFHSNVLSKTAEKQLGTVQKFEDVLSSLSAPSLDSEGHQTLARLDKLLTQIAGLEDFPAWSNLNLKIEAIRNEVDAARRRMLFEGLTISFGEHLREMRQLAAWRTEVQKLEARAQLSQHPGALAVAQELTALDRAGRIIKLDEVRSRLQAVLDLERTEDQSRRRRKAVLDSLAELGYEVQDGLETGIVEGGRLVIRKPHEPEYGVELSINDDSSLVQTALVRYAADQVSSADQLDRDRKREDAWCGEYSQWKDQLRKYGWETTFRLKIPAGEHPVKLIVGGIKGNDMRSNARKPIAQKRAATA